MKMNGLLADAISPEGALLVGACFVLLPFAGVVLVEAVVLWRSCRMPFERAMGWSVVSNVVSAIVGVPILWYFASRFDAWVPSDLNLYFRAFFWFSLLRYLTYFAASVLVEYGVDCSLNPRVIERISPRRLFRGVVLANAASYALVCPIHYYLTRPTNNLRVLSADTSWCSDDSTPIFYIDPESRHLFRTKAVGRPADAVVPYAMSDYQLSGALQTCVYADDTRLYAYRIGGNTPPTLLTTLASADVENGLMSMVSISPSGQRVAFTTAVAATGHTLSILNLASGRTTNCELPVPGTTPIGLDPPAILWTKREDAVLARLETDRGPWRVFRLDRNDVPKVSSEAGTLPSARNYAPQVTKYYPAGSVGGGALPSVPLYAFLTGNLLYQWLEIGPDPGKNLPPDEKGPSDDPENIVIFDPPGIPLLSRHRRFGNVAILPESHLVLFADDTFSTLYMIDPIARRLGKLGRGRLLTVPTAPYEVASLVRR